MSFSRETRNAVRTHRRDSSSHNASRQRPRLLRSSATEPSITTSNAIRGPLASSSSPQKATDLLSRVAVYTPTHNHLEHSSAPESIPRQVEAIVICRDSEASPRSCQDVVLVDSPSGYYFSFPSFDDWNRDKPDLDKDADD
ncbi:hypothetical protein B0J13DRAFT_267382 [Dactylonectria estremocensis]|uniref:Uncharacterized protein n=1 Tax=Dactylonectria estremocensis TaxID=1079267 RepID=A0A9P9J7P8_9HYPO|nr:hypothetical protein B0J13DRAFT_267382 [Dactylonectria estremocensis]